MDMLKYTVVCQTLTDGSYVYNLVVHQGDQAITLRCLDEKAAYELVKGFTDNVALHTVETSDMIVREVTTHA